MARVLCIPDVHLKPRMFDQAHRILANAEADFAVQLGDMADDWGMEFAEALYEDTIEAAIEFQKKHRRTLWCMGNHDFGYYHPEQYGRRESGHSRSMEQPMERLIKRMRRARIKQEIVHLVDNVVFCHAGLSSTWVRDIKQANGCDGYHSLAELVSLINAATPTQLWREDSPIWYRPQYSKIAPWSVRLQVVGHTPVSRPIEKGQVLSTDTFSTDSYGNPLGNNRFVIVDTVSAIWKEVASE